jgi:acyl carrier protein
VETVEDRFDISIPLNILPDVRTVSDFVLQIEKISKDG